MREGKRVLQAVVELDKGQATNRRSRAIGRMLGQPDGRRVARPLRALAEAGLIEERDGGHWHPTQRGRDVDAELAASDVHRGGTFKPLVETSLTQKERSAVL